MNKIDDALKALPDGLTWGQAMDLTPEALKLWKVSGRVGPGDLLTDADRHRLADAISKSTKEENTMTSTNEAADNMFDDVNRPFLLAAQKHRAKLQKSDTEDLFSIARRLRTQVETARAADAKKPATDTALFDASAHRPGWRTDARRKNGEDDDETNSWEHDRRKKQSTKHVRSDDPTKSEEALSDAIDEYRARITDEWRIPSLVEDARRKKRWQERDPQGREAGSGEEELETSDADCYKKYTDDLTSAWRMGKKS